MLRLSVQVTSLKFSPCGQTSILFHSTGLTELLTAQKNKACHGKSLARTPDSRTNASQDTDSLPEYQANSAGLLSIASAFLCRAFVRRM